MSSLNKLGDPGTMYKNHLVNIKMEAKKTDKKHHQNEVV